MLLFFFFFNPFPSSLLSVAPPNGKDPPSALPSPLFSSSLSLCSLALCVCSLSFSPPLSPCALWYADMQEFRPRNDRPNLSVLAPVTKDGRPGSVHACHWPTPELHSARLVFSASSRPFFFSFFLFFIFFFFVGQKCEHQFLFAPAAEGPSLCCCCSPPPSWMDASLLAAVEVLDRLHQFIRFDYRSYDIKTDTIERNTTLKACCLHQCARQPRTRARLFFAPWERIGDDPS